MEEGPAEPARKQASVSISKDPIKEHEDHDNGEEDEIEFDIDTFITPESDTESEAIAKAREQQKEAKNAAVAILRNNSLDSYGHSNSGIDSPDRFAGPIPHPHPISPRHVPHASTRTSSSSSVELRIDGENGDRDDIHSPRAMRESSKSKIPRNRDVDGESARTPRAHEHVHSNLARRVYHAQIHAGRHGLTDDTDHHLHGQLHPSRTQRNTRHSRSLSVDGGSRHAFAVWGHDESDSNTSDSDSQA